MIITIKGISSEVRNKFLNFIENDPADIEPNLGGVSRTNYHHNDHEEDLVALYHDHLQPVIKPAMTGPFTLSGIWYQVYLKNSGSYHEFHNHVCENSQYSAIYYLKLKDNSIATEFKMDGEVKRIRVNEGDMILFDSNLYHRSPPNNTDHDKVIVSFNLMV